MKNIYQFKGPNQSGVDRLESCIGTHEIEILVKHKDKCKTRCNKCHHILFLSFYYLEKHEILHVNGI